MTQILLALICLFLPFIVLSGLIIFLLCSEKHRIASFKANIMNGDIEVKLFKQICESQ